jgi:hypothetical protein
MDSSAIAAPSESRNRSLGWHQITIGLGGADACADLHAPDGRYESPFVTAQGREEMNNPPTKMDRTRRRTLVVLALATAVGSTRLETL